MTRIDSNSNIITFYAYYLGNYVTPRKDFDQKNCVVLHTVTDLNLHLAEKTSRTANLFNVSDTETYWINLAVIGSLIAKVFLKHNINFFIHIFFTQLFLYRAPKRFLTLTTKNNTNFQIILTFQNNTNFNKTNFK